MANTVKIKYTYCHHGWHETGRWVGGKCGCDFRVPTPAVLHVELGRQYATLPESPGVVLVHALAPIADTGVSRACAQHYVGAGVNIRDMVRELAAGVGPEESGLSNLVNVFNMRMVHWEVVGLQVEASFEDALATQRKLRKVGQLARKCPSCNDYWK